MIKKLPVALLIVLALNSCVSMKKYNAMHADAMRLEGELNAAQTRVTDLDGRVERLSNEKTLLIQDSTRLYNDYQYSRNKYNELQEKYRQLLADGSAEASRMLHELEKSQQAMEENMRRVSELEISLKNREEAMNAIRRKVADALTGFEGKGLSISTRNGNVYVSMEDKLLFRSGSFQIDPEGARAVRDLATVLAQNPDINIMVEGHTDDVPYRAAGNLQDNLDLSAKRATTVVRLILENKEIIPDRIVASGRGEWLPVDPAKTQEARAKNRRTEVILSPKLGELMQVVNSTVPAESQTIR